MQPYQEATETIKRRNEQIGSVGRNVATSALAVGAGSFGAGIARRMIPMLSKYVNEEMMQKGLSKIDPRLGKFAQQAKNQGYDDEEIRDFLKNKATGEENSSLAKENTKEKRNIIEQYDPELHTYLLQNIKKGIPIMQAGQQALKHGRFKKAVEKMMKDHKASWMQILESVYGQGQTQQPAQNQMPAQAENPQEAGGIDPQLMQIMGNLRNAMQQIRGGQ